MPPDLPAPARELIAAIESDHIHGASQLARDALAGLAGLARTLPHDRQLLAMLDATAARLMQARPTMAPIENLVGDWRGQLDSLPRDRLPEAAANAALALIDASRAAVERIAAELHERVPTGATIITLSSSSTLDACFSALVNRQIRAIVGESRPGLEGHHTALELAELGIPVTLVTDAALGHHCQQADLALIGADNWLADGAVVNKTGSYLLALAARAAGIPLYVACERFKRSRETARTVALERQDGDELSPPTHANIQGDNLYFEVIPKHLITQVIS